MAGFYYKLHTREREDLGDFTTFRPRHLAAAPRMAWRRERRGERQRLAFGSAAPARLSTFYLRVPAASSVSGEISRRMNSS